MFWFTEPEVVNEQVSTFLQIEKDYLTGDWGITKILISLLIPVSPNEFLRNIVLF